MMNLLLAFFRLLFSRIAALGTPKPAPAPVAPAAPVAVAPAPVANVATAIPPKYLFDTTQNTRHSIRVICDEEGLPLTPTVKVGNKMYTLKDVLCACIEQESQFYNYLPNGKPTKHINLAKDGSVSSTDWGLCQINDYFHIGFAKDFPSVDFVMANPDKVVRWMARLFKAGQMKMWDSFKSGAYEKYLPQN